MTRVYYNNEQKSCLRSIEVYFRQTIEPALSSSLLLFLKMIKLFEFKSAIDTNKKIAFPIELFVI